MSLLRYPALLAVGVMVLLAAAACGGGDDDEATPTGGTGSPSAAAPSSQPSGELSGVVITSDLTTGPNRFAVGVVDANGPVLGADVSLNFLKMTSANQGVARFQSDTDYHELERFIIDDATGEKTTTGATGAYVTEADFDEVGDWAVQITGSTEDGTAFGPINLAFSVAAPEDVLSVGDPAPKSRQALAGDVADIREIESMNPPDEMHDVSIADAVTSGKPTVILFGTPAFCETLVCGPVMEAIMLPLYDQYSEQANFIHVEPYFLEEVRRGGLCAVPAFNLELARAGVAQGSGPCPSLSEEELAAVGESWNLTTEPIIFVVDADGKIAGKFEAVVGPEEVESLLAELV